MDRKGKIATIVGVALLGLFITNLIVGIFALNPSILGEYDTWHETYGDSDKLSDDEYIVCGFPLGGLPLFGMLNKNRDYNRIYIINQSKELVWEYNGLYFPHEVELITSGSTSEPAFLVANAAVGGVDQISYPGKELEWQWLPELINWTEINPLWDQQSEINNPSIDYGQYIVNDVDFINGSLYGDCFDSIMISVKRFCLIVFVNYTREMEEAQMGDKFGNTSNIYWTFGDDGVTQVLNQQHNPDMMPNGNLLISDSENERMIEVNRTTKTIVWEQNQAGGVHFSLAKDIDYLNDSETFLVTDTGNNRVLEMNRDGDVIWQYEGNDLMLPYESDLLPNGNVLISGGGAGIIIEYNPSTKQVVWSFDIHGENNFEPYHINYPVFLISFNLVYITMMLIIEQFHFVILYRKTREAKIEKLEDKKQKRKKIGFIVLSMVIVALIIIAIFGKTIIYEIAAILFQIATKINPIMPQLP